MLRVLVDRLRGSVLDDLAETMPAWIDTSSAETGSSSTSIVGSNAIARAMPTRWR
jgi:hypothetical protein